MTIDKAIEILDLNVRQRSPRMPPDVLNALRLAIQALKFTESSRDPGGVPPYTLLPGETKE